MIVNPKTLTTGLLHDLLADCLSGASSEKPLVSESFFRDGLSASLREQSPSIEITRQIFAAGLLTYGHISMVEVILDNMPFNVVSQRATGYCVAGASTVLSAMLPLPDSLATCGRTLVDAQAVRTWFREHKDRLYFDSAAQRFRLCGE